MSQVYHKSDEVVLLKQRGRCHCEGHGIRKRLLRPAAREHHVRKIGLKEELSGNYDTLPSNPQRFSSAYCVSAKANHILARTKVCGDLLNRHLTLQSPQ